MEISALSDGRRARLSGFPQLADIVDGLGRPDFGARIFRIAHDAVGCEMLSAIAFDDADQRDVIVATGSAPAPIACATSRYVSCYWNADPVNEVSDSDELVQHGVLVRSTPEEMRANLYRRELFGEAAWAQFGSKLIERVTIFKRRGGETIRLSLYRHQDNGPFQRRELNAIDAVSDLLVSAVVKHKALAPPPARPEQLRARYERVLGAVAPALTAREREVCACIAAGLHSEAIALTLNIKLNTVLTHRKNAYARLGVSSQNEIMRLILPHASGAGAPTTATAS